MVAAALPRLPGLREEDPPRAPGDNNNGAAGRACSAAARGHLGDISPGHRVSPWGWDGVSRRLPTARHPPAASGEKQPIASLGTGTGHMHLPPLGLSRGSAAEPGFLCNSPLSTNEDYPSCAQQLRKVSAPAKLSTAAPVPSTIIATHPDTTAHF